MSILKIHQITSMKIERDSIGTVSIVMPVYNSEKCLVNAIESVLCQDYTDIELILINDASDDDSIVVMNDYLKKDPRVVVINLDKNVGPAQARNIGIKKASGNFLLTQMIK